jgi:hypothetical protein
VREYAVAPIQYRGVALRHVGPRDAIEINVEHGCLLKSRELGTAAAGFQVTRLTEASFIVSTPRPVEAKLLRWVDPIKARKAISTHG